MQKQHKEMKLAIWLLLAISCYCYCFGDETVKVYWRLPNLISDNMVLQREQANKIWGWDQPGLEITVSFCDKTAAGKVNDEGKWSITLPPLPAGGPYELTIKGSQEKVIQNVLIGEVWLGSGQSNMKWMVSNSNNADEEMRQADYPEIRLFTVPRRGFGQAQEKCGGQWLVCSGDTVEQFSAVLYFFGRDLHKQLKMPVGLINSSVGGTAAERWISKEGVEKHEELHCFLEELAAQKDAGYEAVFQSFLNKVAAWEETYLPELKKNQGIELGWEKPDFNDTAWQTMNLPAFLETQDLDIDGVVWFRKTIDLPEVYMHQPLVLSLGILDDCDQTYVNGRLVGTTDFKTDQWWLTSRRYEIPAELVTSDKLTIAVRLYDSSLGGGFGGPADRMKLLLASESTTPAVLLQGAWRYKVDFAIDYAKVPPRPKLPSPTGKGASTLYNAMIAPLINYGIRGAIWYQGESNVGRAEQYKVLFPALIQDWREKWQQGDFPFYFVQLAGYIGKNSDLNYNPDTLPAPAEDRWMDLCEAQAAALSLPNTAMAVAMDIGEPFDVHPRNKQETARRLSLPARALLYGEKALVYSGPMYKEAKIEGDKVRISFDHVGSGLAVKGDGPLKWFVIAGEDKKFVHARAEIQGDTVVVWHKDVPAPKYVRYAWYCFPQGANLINKEGLPAGPFRTDRP